MLARLLAAVSISMATKSTACGEGSGRQPLRTLLKPIFSSLVIGRPNPVSHPRSIASDQLPPVSTKPTRHSVRGQLERRRRDYGRLVCQPRGAFVFMPVASASASRVRGQRRTRRRRRWQDRRSGRRDWPATSLPLRCPCRRKSTIDGPDALDRASNSPKSVSALTTMRCSSRANARTSRSIAVAIATSRTWTASWPAAARRSTSNGDWFWSSKNLTRADAAATHVSGQREPRIAGSQRCLRLPDQGARRGSD